MLKSISKGNQSLNSVVIALTGFAVILFLLKLFLLPWVHVVDADAVTRVYHALDFSGNPHVIKEGNWPPLYFYVMGGALMLVKDPLFTPIVINILFSVALLFPLFFLLKRHFGGQIALALCVFFSFSPIVFRLSLQAMSEVSYLFFLLIGINLLSKSLVEAKPNWSVLSGLFMTLAGGFRYESWIIGVLIIILLAYHRRNKDLLYFSLPFVVFPLYWLVSNYIYAQDALNSFNWAINPSTEEQSPSFLSILRRIWWFPLSLLFAFGPVAFFFFVREMRYFNASFVGRILFTVFVVFMAVWLVNALRGSLLLQHRFTLTLFVLGFPILGFYFKRNSNKLWVKTGVFSLTAFLLAYTYSSKGARPVPRIQTKGAIEVSRAIEEKLGPQSAFICDFWNWETTYFLPFSTGLPPSQIKIKKKGETQTSIQEEIKHLIARHPQGVLLVHKNHNLERLVEKSDSGYTLTLEHETMPLKPFFEQAQIQCFTFGKNNDIQSDIR